MDQLTLLPDDAEYDAFVDKFKPKKTTDDCYTPPEIYETVKSWVCARYAINEDLIVRPFWPGGDYESFPYQPGNTVLDNPPFSILSKIIKFYLDKDIKFFLFAPSLTAFSGRSITMRCDHIICDCDIVYDNGAVVRTSFRTNLGDPDIVAETAPDLTKAVNDCVDRLRRAEKVQLPKYDYPDHVLTAAMMQRYAKYGIDLRIRKKDCVLISALDAQRPVKKSIFGGGLLLSDEAAAERAAAERAAAERAAAERAAAERAAAHVWRLSERETGIVQNLGGG